jgi:multidrug efflux pump subunit AcrA (membrane-fusion protein)
MTKRETTLKPNLASFSGGKVPANSSVIPPPDSNNGWDDNDGSGSEKLPELRSEAVNEIMNNPPNWLVRWGISFVFLLLISILAISHFVSYPDRVNGRFIIQANDKPKIVRNEMPGYLEVLMVKEGDIVSLGQSIGLVHNESKYEEVIMLENYLEKVLLLMKVGNLQKLKEEEPPYLSELGNLQKSFQTFTSLLFESKSYQKSGTFVAKRNMLSSEKESLFEVERNLKNQRLLLIEELEQAEIDFQKKQRLFKNGLIAEGDVLQANSVFLLKKQALQQADNQLASHKVLLLQKQQDILDADFKIEEQYNKLVHSIAVMNSELSEWKRKYLLTAPNSGTVVFNKPVEVNQFFEIGSEICLIQPLTDGYYAQMDLGQYNSGRVAVKQDVILKLNAYPYQQYGIIYGKVKYISSLPADSLFNVKISLPDPLVTDMGNVLPYQSGLAGNAEIITKEVSLLGRFFSEINKIRK